MTKDATKTIGMDLGDTWSVLCVLDENGEVIEQSPSALVRIDPGLLAKNDPPGHSGVSW